MDDTRADKEQIEMLGKQSAMKDENGLEIYKGDVLISEDGYAIVVRVEPETGLWYGQLVCSANDSCAGVPYSLNNGRGYKKLSDMSTEETKAECWPSLIIVRWKEVATSKSPKFISVSFLSVKFDKDDIANLKPSDENSIIAAAKAHREKEVGHAVNMKDIEIDIEY